jgi:hypothetical protein
MWTDMDGGQKYKFLSACAWRHVLEQILSIHLLQKSIHTSILSNSILDKHILIKLGFSFAKIIGLHQIFIHILQHGVDRRKCVRQQL